MKSPAGMVAPSCKPKKRKSMTRLFRLIVPAALALAVLSASAHAGFYPLMADDGAPVENHRVPARYESQIDKLPGVVVAGNPRGKVTLAEFYDLNCPFCRKASGDIDKLLRKHPDLRLVLVPFPVLGVASVQGTRVELAVARLTSPEKFYVFHRKLDSSRGMVDGNRALAAAEAIGLDRAKVLKIANEDALAKVMAAHLRLGDRLLIAATPGFVIGGIAILGYPGPKAMAKVIESVKRCGAPMCNVKTR
jgi:protein-disulfide isomerase